MCLAFKTLNGLEFCYKFLSTLICVAGADMKTVTLQTMVIWPLPMTLRGYTLGDFLAEYLADENIKDWECFKYAHGEAVMKKTVVSWPRVFVICLQRFSNGEKNEAPLCFTEVWQSAEKEIEPDHEYLLQAVVTHLGEYKCSSNCCTWRRTVK
ncbi:uncharacterized protein LOC124193739 [Daphnia pulex]|uniref:uncharacterized protein LOC124193739 n=1 Tax=Daphnia pulex TaxID=6669 RepID=UPI001EDE1E54|nr:uncharacterized protein LOC124193739 [Daphnia pulex]